LSKRRCCAHHLVVDESAGSFLGEIEFDGFFKDPTGGKGNPSYQKAARIKNKKIRIRMRKWICQKPDCDFFVFLPINLELLYESGFRVGKTNPINIDKIKIIDIDKNP